MIVVLNLQEMCATGLLFKHSTIAELQVDIMNNIVPNLPPSIKTIIFDEHAALVWQYIIDSKTLQAIYRTELEKIRLTKECLV